jgi:hypothetical protein
MLSNTSGCVKGKVVGRTPIREYSWRREQGSEAKMDGSARERGEGRIKLGTSASARGRTGRDGMPYVESRHSGREGKREREREEGGRRAGGSGDDLAKREAKRAREVLRAPWPSTSISFIRSLSHSVRSIFPDL